MANCLTSSQQCCIIGAIYYDRLFIQVHMTQSLSLIVILIIAVLVLIESQFSVGMARMRVKCVNNK